VVAGFCLHSQVFQVKLSTAARRVIGGAAKWFWSSEVELCGVIGYRGFDQNCETRTLQLILTKGPTSQARWAFVSLAASGSLSLFQGPRTVYDPTYSCDFV
jgi:hypothetical protein